MQENENGSGRVDVEPSLASIHCRAVLSSAAEGSTADAFDDTIAEMLTKYNKKIGRGMRVPRFINAIDDRV